MALGMQLLSIFNDHIQTLTYSIPSFTLHGALSMLCLFPFPFSFSHHFFFLSHKPIHTHTHIIPTYTYTYTITCILTLCIPYSLQIIPFICWTEFCINSHLHCGFPFGCYDFEIFNSNKSCLQFGTVCFLHACSRFKVEIERISYPIYTLGGISFHLNFVQQKQFDVFHDKHFH